MLIPANGIVALQQVMARLSAMGIQLQTRKLRNLHWLNPGQIASRITPIFKRKRMLWWQLPPSCRDMADKQNEHGLRAILAVYWHAYGGWRAVFSSPFFWFSALLLPLTHRYWYFDLWWEQTLSVMPNLLGFTLGGFAVFLGFGDEKFKSLIAGSDDGAPNQPSPYIEVCSAFLHFVLIQVVALVAAIIGRATNFDLAGNLEVIGAVVEPVRWIFDMLGYWLFLYGICLAAAAAIAIFRVAFWFDRYQTDNKEDA